MSRLTLFNYCDIMYVISVVYNYNIDCAARGREKPQSGQMRRSNYTVDILVYIYIYIYMRSSKALHVPTDKDLLERESTVVFADDRDKKRSNN